MGQILAYIQASPYFAYYLDIGIWIVVGWLLVKITVKTWEEMTVDWCAFCVTVFWVGMIVVTFMLGRHDS